MLRAEKEATAMSMTAPAVDTATIRDYSGLDPPTAHFPQPVEVTPTDTWQYDPILARTRTVPRPVGPLAYDSPLRGGDQDVKPRSNRICVFEQ